MIPFSDSAGSRLRSASGSVAEVECVRGGEVSCHLMEG